MSKYIRIPCKREGCSFTFWAVDGAHPHKMYCSDKCLNLVRRGLNV